MINAIMACDGQGGIGRNNSLPWPHNKKDLEHFKKITQGSTVVMGRKTWESSGMPKPLPKRHNVVVTQDSDYKAQGAEVVNDITSYLTSLPSHNNIFLIGGAALFGQLIDQVSVLHLTRIAGNYDCNTFISLDDLDSKFKIIEQVQIDQMTMFETHISRGLHDLSITTKI